MRVYLLRLSLAVVLLAALPALSGEGSPLLVKSLADSGPGTLRSAILSANSLAGGNTILFVVDGTIELLSPLPPITETLTIGSAGREIVISGASLGGDESGGPLFDVPPGAHLNIEGLHMQASAFSALKVAGEAVVVNCHFSGNSSEEGGAIANTGLLSLENSTFTANASYLGGAIANRGALQLRQVLFEGNRSWVDAGALYNQGTLEGSQVSFIDNQANEDTGGAMVNSGKARFEDSRFTGNSVHNGGGGIGNSGELTLVNVDFRANSAKWGGGLINFPSGSADISGGLMQGNFAGGHFGGAIDNGGRLSLTGVVLRENGSAEYGGAVSNNGTARIEQTTFDANYAWVGGGLYNGGRVDILASSVFINNWAQSDGGGIFNGGYIKISSATFDSNRAVESRGGALLNQGILTLDQATLTANSALISGGGLANLAPASATIGNTTMDANSAGSGGGIYNTGGMQIAFATLANNISADGAALANLPGSQLEASYTILAYSSPGGNCSGAISAGWMNISDDDTCSPGFLEADPRLGLLAQNGGPAATHLLLPGSPAIDADSSASCFLATDQRGLPRPMGLGCDAGAVEMEQTAVKIDLIPISAANRVDPTRRGHIPVAILSTADFDAPRRVATASLTFGRTGWEPSLYITSSGHPACNFIDLNGDARLDVVCGFNIQDTGLRCGDQKAILRGRSAGGEWLVGQDVLQTICR